MPKKGETVSSQTRRRMSEAAKRRQSRIIGRYGFDKAFYDQQIAAGRLWCSTCKLFKDAGEFPKAKIQTRCLPCQRATCRAHYARNKEKHCARRSLYAKQNAEAEHRRDRKAHLANYGIDHVWYEATLAAQNGVCAICANVQVHKKHGYFCIDHCHTTGIVRGLLCSNCNTRLGHLEANPSWPDRARAYLAKSATLRGTPVPPTI